MAFKWMKFSIKRNAGALKGSKGLEQLLSLDTDVYSQLGTTSVDTAYAAYRTSYKAFKTELKKAQIVLTKLRAEQQNTLDALQALQGRVQGVDNQLMKELGSNKKATDAKAEARYKAMIKHLFDFSGDVSELQSLEAEIQENFRSLSVLLAGSKRAQE